MRKIFKSRLFFFVLGVLVTITSTVFAYSYLAGDVGFTPVDVHWNVDNTESALNYLRDADKFEKASFIYGIFPSSRVSVWAGASRDGDYISLNSNNALYSINGKNIPASCYFIIINGAGLTNSLIADIVNEVGGAITQATNVKQTSNFLYYYVNLTSNINKGSFRIWNNSNNVIKIKTAYIFDVGTCPS